MNTSFLRVALIAAWGFMRRSSLRRVSRQLAGSFPGLGMELRFRSATGISPGGRSRSGRRQFLSVSCGYTPFRSEWKLKKLHPRSFLIELVLDRGIQLAGHRLADTGKFSGRNSIIRNSHLHDGFVRGLLIKAASRIEHNLVERTGAAGILVMPDFYFLENPWPEDVFILRNTFRENNLSINGKRFAAGSGAISILQPQTPGGRGSIRNIRVEENLLESPAAIGILLSGVTGGTICGNRIKAPFTGWESCPVRRDLEKYPYAICLTADRDLKLENNRVEQLPPGISEQNQPAQ